MITIEEKEQYRCGKCGKLMSATNFFTNRDGSKTEYCKKCLTMHVDNFDPNTYLWILEKINVPYIPQEWNNIRDKAYAKDPRKMDGMSVMGKYLAKMRLKNFADYTWEDSEKAQSKYSETDQSKIEAHKKFEEDILERYKEGLINEAEYRTLTGSETQYSNEIPEIPTQPVVGLENLYDESNFMSEDELTDLGAELTKEDRLYLAMKWGRLYKPNEWVELEKKYNEMMNSFDIHDSDTIGTLVIICKTYLKMNQAIDCGDVEGFQKLSRVYDSLRKSAKFTAAQNKETKEDFVDCVGEIVAYCEKNGGRIPEFDISEPRDIIDVIINDLKEYNKTLIYEDKALANQIEDYLKRKQIAEEMEEDLKRAKEQGLDTVELTTEDYKKFYQVKEDDFFSDTEVIEEEKRRD